MRTDIIYLLVMVGAILTAGAYWHTAIVANRYINERELSRSSKLASAANG